MVWCPSADGTLSENSSDSLVSVSAAYWYFILLQKAFLFNFCWCFWCLMGRPRVIWSSGRLDGLHFYFIFFSLLFTRRSKKELPIGSDPLFSRGRSSVREPTVQPNRSCQSFLFFSFPCFFFLNVNLYISPVVALVVHWVSLNLTHWTFAERSRSGRRSSSREPVEGSRSSWGDKFGFFFFLWLLLNFFYCEMWCFLFLFPFWANCVCWWRQSGGWGVGGGVANGKDASVGPGVSSWIWKRREWAAWWGTAHLGAPCNTFC